MEQQPRGSHNHALHIQAIIETVQPLSCDYLKLKWWVQVKYGQFMNGLSNENIDLNRKVLSELAMHEPYSFKSLVDISRIAFTQVIIKQ